MTSGHMDTSTLGGVDMSTCRRMDAWMLQCVNAAMRRQVDASTCAGIGASSSARHQCQGHSFPGQAIRSDMLLCCCSRSGSCYHGTLKCRIRIPATGIAPGCYLHPLISIGEASPPQSTPIWLGKSPLRLLLAYAEGRGSAHADPLV